jgi:hypothetical protein
VRAIIIDDKDSKAPLERLKLEVFENRAGAKMSMLMEDIRVGGKVFTEQDRRWIVEDIHRAFHFIVCSWLQ